MTDDGGAVADDGSEVDVGFVITKTPLDSGRVMSALAQAEAALAQGRRVGLFLISDGVWLARRGQDNSCAAAFQRVVAGGAAVTVSPEHLSGAGITPAELLDGMNVAGNTYRSLVECVMEKWRKIVVV